MGSCASFALWIELTAADRQAAHNTKALFGLRKLERPRQVAAGSVP